MKYEGLSDMGIKDSITPGIDPEARMNPLYMALADNLESTLRSSYFQILEAAVLQNNIEV